MMSILNNGLLILILIVVGYIIYKIYTSPEQQRLRNLYDSKTPRQQEVLYYFLGKKPMFYSVQLLTDNDYIYMVKNVRGRGPDMEQVIEKVGLDEEQVQDLEPISFEGFQFKDAYSKRNALGLYVSSTYQYTDVLFTQDQIILYTVRFELDEGTMLEVEDEFFYKDITNFETYSSTYIDGPGEESNSFRIIVPNSSIIVPLGDLEEAREKIQGLEQLIRERKYEFDED